MSQERNRYPVEQVKDRAEQAVKRSANFIWKISNLRTNISIRVKNYLRLILDYLVPPHKTTDPKEMEWVTYAALAGVYFLPGEDSIGSYCSMTPKERVRALNAMALFYCKKLNIKPHQVELVELPPNIPGSYHYAVPYVQLNKELVESQPITREKAEKVISTLFHEIFHAYQNVAMYQPNKYGIAKEVAADWRRNRKDYCPPHKNPMLYQSQSLEASARWVAGEAMGLIMDPETVNLLRENFGKGGE